MKSCHFFMKLLTFFVSYIFSLSLAAQKILDLQSIFSDITLYPRQASHVAWIPETSELSYCTDYKTLEKIKIPSLQKEIITQVHLLNNLLDSLANVVPLKKITLRYLPTIQWINKHAFVFHTHNMFFLFNVPFRKLELLHQLPEDAESIDFCKENKLVAYTRGNNLFIMRDGHEIAITNETDPNVRMCNYVHREEFGIKKGTFWSPLGNYLAFYRMDETDVTNYPLVDITQRIATIVPEKYPMAGMNSHYVTLGVYDLHTGNTVFMQTGEPRDQYLTSVTWSPDEKFVFIGLLNREQNHFKLNMYDARTGKMLKTIFEEKSEKYVEPLHPLFFIPGRNNEFLWLSQRDGYMHIYHYDTSGRLIRQLTRGRWMVREIIGFNNNGKYVYFRANRESPIEWHLYRLEIKTGQIILFTPIEGVHQGNFDPSGKYCFSQFSNLTTPSQLSIFNEGKLVTTLLKSENPLKNYAMPEISIIPLKNSQGDVLYARLITPPHLTTTNKYPVIVYVYGGPHVQLVTRSWLADAELFLIYLAQKGYVVFTLDNRGSAYRGFEFETATFRNLGSVECIDQYEGIKYLKTLPFIDTNRIGVYGWSYGGYMTIRLMLEFPDVFKVGVAGGPVCDWKYYEVMYGERYMGTPQNNPEGYERASLLNKISSLKGRLLVIHGAMDPVVVWQHSLMLLVHAINEKKHIDYFVFPTDKHGVKWQNYTYLYEKIYQYFETFL